MFEYRDIAAEGEISKLQTKCHLVFSPLSLYTLYLLAIKAMEKALLVKMKSNGIKGQPC